MLRPMTATPPPQTTSTPRASRLAGYLLALAAGATWGNTGPLSTGLYALMPATSIGFWRVLLGAVRLAARGRGVLRGPARGRRGAGRLEGAGGRGVRSGEAVGARAVAGELVRSG